MQKETTELIILAIDQVNFHGGTIVVLNGGDKIRVTYENTGTIIEKM